MSQQQIGRRLIDLQGGGIGAEKNAASTASGLNSARYVPNRTDSVCPANYHLFSCMRVCMRSAARAIYGSATTDSNLAER